MENDKKVLIEVKNLCKKFPDATPLKDVNATIYQGDIISIIGPSGTGKSTFLRCLNYLNRPTSGQIIVDGYDLSDKKTDIKLVRQKMGMVFQSFNLFAHKTIIENVMMGQIDLLHKSKQEAYDRALELLEIVGLKEKALSFPEELSGGQKQRAAIARTLSMNPEIILFDEPTSALDPTMVDEVLTVIKNLAAKGLTMLIVTHEMNFAKNVSNRIFFMDEGIIYEDGSPKDIFENPQKQKTRQFINKLKVCEFDFDRVNNDFSYCYTQIFEFGKKSMISPSKLYYLRLAFEEICYKHIFNSISGSAHINIEYSQEKTESVLTITYQGEEIKFMDEVDELEKEFINVAVKDINVSKEGDTNIVKIIIH